ncbi:MAG: Tim44/TimA family putative adaptor protein [Rhizobiales bacterium]|nr:Tim44/TimA family putative adaptor protein [Hyphomicrobiales bacterium]
MNGSLDIGTLLFLVLAVVIFLRLRSVLGRRTGNERPPIDPYAPREAARAPRDSEDNVVPLPRSGQPEPQATYGREDTPEDLIRDFMPNGGAIAAGLLEIAKLDRSFEPKHFLQGARTAYELIVTSFAEGNRKMLRQLLSPEVFQGFDQAISEREKRGEVADTNFVGINKADIVEAELRNRTAQITVKFVSQLITAIRNRQGDVVDGDPSQVREVTDIWTFARDLGSRDPNWKLVETQAAN